MKNKYQFYRGEVPGNTAYDGIEFGRFQHCATCTSTIGTYATVYCTTTVAGTLIRFTLSVQVQEVYTSIVFLWRNHYFMKTIVFKEKTLCSIDSILSNKNYFNALNPYYEKIL